MFQTLNYSRQYHPSGHPIAFSNQEVLAWCTLNNEKLTKQHLSLIRQMDATWINTRNELQREINNRG